MRAGGGSSSPPPRRNLDNQYTEHELLK